MKEIELINNMIQMTHSYSNKGHIFAVDVFPTWISTVKQSF